jgi:DNA polymerase-1
MRHLVGRDVEVWAADSIADAFVLLGLEHPLTKAGKPSFTAGWLETHEHAFPQLIVEARRVNKLYSTFLQNYFLETHENGRIHATFTPLRSDEGGAVTGRFTCANPNWQNLPARSGDSASTVRGCVEPEDGDLWAALDYSSQEPRLTVHWAAAAKCPGADKAVAEYVKNPRTDYHQFVADLTGLTRKNAKTVNLGLPYGMGGPKLCKESLGLPTRLAVFPRGEEPIYFEHEQREEAGVVAQNVGRNVIEVAGEEGQAILDQYHERLPYLKKLMKLTEQTAAGRGYIRTILGRRRNFLGDREKVTKYNRKKAFPYKALNCLIQGSAADMTKQAMIDLHREGFRIKVTVHDELGLSVQNEKDAHRAAEIMRNAVPMLLPNIVDVEIGDSWAASMGLPVDD